MVLSDEHTQKKKVNIQKKYDNSGSTQPWSLQLLSGKEVQNILFVIFPIQN